MLRMKTIHLLLATTLLVSTSACQGPRRPVRSAHSAGGRVVTPMERHDRSALSPGGAAITPRERRSRWERGTR